MYCYEPFSYFFHSKSIFFNVNLIQRKTHIIFTITTKHSIKSSITSDVTVL